LRVGVEGWGSGFRVKVLELRVYMGLGFRVWDLGFRLYRVGFRVQGVQGETSKALGCRVLDSGLGLRV